MITAEQIQAGFLLAHLAGVEMHNKVGERDACGFGWVEVYVDRTNSPQAKELIKAGFKKDYKPKCLNYWDPAKIPTQSISVKEAGAQALATYLQSLGLRAYAGSRMD
jgi:hypothetical protein